LEVKLKQEEQREADRQSIFALCKKGKSMSNESLGKLSKEIFFYDVITFLSDNGFLAVDRVFNQPPLAIRKASMADILALFKKDENI